MINSILIFMSISSTQEEYHLPSRVKESCVFACQHKTGCDLAFVFQFRCYDTIFKI